jgi:hypothetical protein
VHVVSPAPVVPIGDGLRFRADFYLPAARQRIIVLPSFDAFDDTLHRRALEVIPRRAFIGDEGMADIPVVIAMPGGVLRAWNRERLADGPVPDVALYCCAECSGWWFLEESQGWVCQCCGHYDGSRTMKHQIGGFPSGRVTPFPLTKLPPHF